MKEHDRLISNLTDEKAAALGKRLYVDMTSWRGTDENLSTLPIVQDAVARGRKLNFRYWRAGHECVERTVDPLGLVLKGPAWYLVALTPDGMRTYRVSRIETATMLESACDRPPDFDLADYWNSSTQRFWEGLPRYHVTLRLEKRAATWMKMWRPASVVQEETSEDPENWITLRVEFDNEEQACFVVLGLGARAEALEPASLRERVALDAAAGMAASIENMDANSFAPLGFDELFRELEAHRRSVARKRESERRAAQELEIAKQVQARLFPQSSPRLNSLDFAGICIQAREVGGDYYDFLDLGQDRLGLVIGDISGKGIAAALLMANLQANLRSQCAIALDQPQRMLRSVNRLFYENTSDNAYATLVFVLYEETARRLRYVNCGHHSALLLRANGTLERLNSTCTVLGLFREWECPIEERCLCPGDTLVLYTDGVTESFNEAGEEYGEQRLADALRQYRSLPPQALLSTIVDEVRRFSPHEQHDDITLIVAKCRGNEASDYQL
jgi:serine phosphatase RsbU (regulator of sigma subunit)